MSGKTEPIASFPAELYDAYSAIMSLARDINTHMEPPEIVFVGKKGSGKTALIDALLGHKLGDVGNATQRPVEIKLVNNSECEQPRVTLMRDTILKQFEQDAVVPFAKVPEAIKERNAKSPIPIRIQYEFKYCWGMTFYDTPGLLPNTSSSAEIEETESLVISMMQPAHRLIVCVEEVSDWERVQIADFAAKVDPKRTRTVFVFNKFATFLKNFSSFRELAVYFGANPLGDSQVFFTTLPSDTSRLDSPNLYKKRVAAIIKADKNALEQLQYDRRYEKSIGVTALHKSILDQTWKKYQEFVPEVLKRLRNHKKQAQDNLEKVTSQLEAMQPNQLRASSSSFLSEFLQAIEDLVQGSLEGKPSQNGQTLIEEKTHEDAGEWHDYERREITFDPADWKIPSHNSKLYGGQQLERLLAEFKAVVERSATIQVSRHEIASALGTSKSGLAPDLVWAASDLVRVKSVQVLRPLVSQLIKRATYIMKNLINIAEKVLEYKHRQESRRIAQSSAASGSYAPPVTSASFDQYPYFVSFVKDSYNKYVNDVAESCLRKCEDEFSCTQLVCWQAKKDGRLPDLEQGGSQEQINALVSKLVQDLFADIKERVKTNVMLKCYNFFLVPMQSQLILSLHGSLSTLSDDQLCELFEVAISKARLTGKQEYWTQIINTFLEQEKTFMSAAVNFSHPLSSF